MSQDFTAVVLAIKRSSAHVVASYFTFENDLAIFARQLRQLGVTLPWVGSQSIMAATAIRLAGPAGILCAAINKAGSTDQEKIRAAIISVKGLNGAEGECNFDEFGDGLHGCYTKSR